MAGVFKALLTNADETKKRKNTLCGRAIQYRELSADEVEESDAEGLRKLNKPEIQREDLANLRKLQWREGTIAMLVAVSKQDKLTAQQFLELKESDWVKVTPAKLETDSVYGFDTLFRRAKDRDAVIAIFRRMHEVTSDEVDDIMGKAIEVSTESEV